MEAYTIKAPAKLNLTLDVLGKRPDGYHDLRMVMQSISLCDTLRIRVSEGGGIRVRTTEAALPEGPDNLAFRAAAAFFSAVDRPCPGVEIFIEKKIPFCAGMAGGSSDAAAVLRALRALFCPELPPAELERIGAGVGSDVPFCVRGGTALAQGRGEILTDWPPLPACTLVVCKPPFGLSTPELFHRVDACPDRRRPDPEGMRRALENEDLPGVAALLCNAFEDVLTAEEAEAVSAIRLRLLEAGALGAAMTGSGPTVFGIFSGADAAERAAAALTGLGRKIALAHPLGRNPF